MSASEFAAIRTPSYTLADAMLELQMPDWVFALNVTNLFDKEYFAPCRYFGDCFSGNRARSSAPSRTASDPTSRSRICRANTLKLWFLVHKWTSLVCTVFLLLLCLTGLPLIF